MNYQKPGMDNKTVDSIIENLFYVLPVVRKKLLKIEPQYIDRNIKISRLHLGIMGILSKKSMPVSEIAKRFLISKPQMTYLINQLVKAGLVERQSNAEDRRVTDISLTSRGRIVLKQCQETFKNNLREQLSYLNGQELEGLAQSLIKIREIGNRLEERGR
jgi:DNA-binding MarR family transcriptional regulator